MVVSLHLHNNGVCHVLKLTCVSARVGGRRGWAGADVRRDAHWQLPVDGEAERRGGEHGENLPTAKSVKRRTAVICGEQTPV